MTNLSTVFEKSDAKYRAQVMFATWGHLDAPVGANLPCTLVFAISLYDHGAAAVIKIDIKLAGGPAFYSDMHTLFERAKREPGLYQFKGHYKCHKNGTAKFYGPIKKIKLPI